MWQLFSAASNNKLSITLVIFITVIFSSLSHANLMISPTRVVFEEGKRTSTVTLVNRSNETKTYRIELQNKIQAPEGNYIDISANASYPGNSAMEFIRYSPRVVTIAPGKYQKIKLNVRFPGVISPGEYRVHLAMRSISSKNSGSGSKNTERGLHTQIVPKMSFSIPVIVRHGTSSISTNIKSIQFVPQKNNESKPNLDIELARAGNVSSYGSVNAYMKLPNSTSVNQIGKIGNVAVYTELDARHVKIPLWVDSIPENAIIQIIYTGEDEYDGQTLGTAAFRYNN